MKLFQTLLISVLLTRIASAAAAPTEEFKRRQDLVYAAFDRTLFAGHELVIGFEYSEKEDYLLRIQWRGNFERHATQDEMEDFRNRCVEASRRLAAKLGSELKAIPPESVQVFETIRYREFSPDTYPRNGIIPLHFRLQREATK